MRRWRLEDAPELRSAGGQPHERRTCPLQPQVRETDGRLQNLKGKQRIGWLKFYTRAALDLCDAQMGKVREGERVETSEAAVFKVSVCV